MAFDIILAFIACFQAGALLLAIIHIKRLAQRVRELERQE